MKGLALCTLALGLMVAMAAPSWAGQYYPGSYVPHHHHRVYYSQGVVVRPAPVYGYAAYPGYGTVLVPGNSTIVPVPPVVGPAPYYYYNGPVAAFGYRGRGFAAGVRF